MDAAVKRITDSALHDLACWVLKHPDIAFSTAVTLLDDDTVIEAGRIVASNGMTQPLFRGAPLRHCGFFGGALWHRNVSAAGDTAVAFKRASLRLSEHRQAGWQKALEASYAEARRDGHRGVVVPSARVYLDTMPATQDGWHDSMRDDPYFHPAFRSVAPLELDTD